MTSNLNSALHFWQDSWVSVAALHLRSAQNDICIAFSAHCKTTAGAPQAAKSGSQLQAQAEACLIIVSSIPILRLAGMV